MATSTTSMCLCTLTIVLCVTLGSSSPIGLYTEYDDVIDRENPSSNTEYQILSDIEDELKKIEIKLFELETLAAPEVPATSLESAEKRFGPGSFYNARQRRGDWGDGSLEADESELTPRDHLLDLIKTYNYLRTQRDIEVPSYLANKRQVPQGFHAVRGKRKSMSYPTFKRPSSLDFPVSRRDPPVQGFYAVRGKK